MDDRSVVEMSVVKVSPYLKIERPLLWLCEKTASRPRLLPIAIGQFEAAAIQMQLDQCLEFPHTEKDAEKAMRLSLRWADRSRKAFGRQPGRGNFGIVQGGVNERLRRESAEGLKSIGFEGYAMVDWRWRRSALMLQPSATTLSHRSPALSHGCWYAETSWIGGAASRIRLRLPTDLDRPGLHPFRQDQLRNARHAGPPASRPGIRVQLCPSIHALSAPPDPLWRLPA
jgi:queuine tRNA-ribosyltransferase